jgi:hypothetical protein
MRHARLETEYMECLTRCENALDSCQAKRTVFSTEPCDLNYRECAEQCGRSMDSGPGQEVS